MIIKVTIPNQIQLKVAPKLRSMFFAQKGEIHYIGGAEILPAPFNAEEENRAIMGLETEQEAQPHSLSIIFVWLSTLPKNLRIPEWVWKI